MNKNIFIGGAWPYANGSLHIGNMAALVPSDILARYHRAKGDHVIYVSVSDCHGTPISIRATKEGIDPEIISMKYHVEFSECFEKMKFTFDNYTSTLTEEHEAFVKTFFNDLIENGSLYERMDNQVHCNHCFKFLPDRYVNGICPVCGSDARGYHGKNNIPYHYSQLLGSYGNFINRTLVFINKYFDSKIPGQSIDEEVKQRIRITYEKVSSEIEVGNFREAISEIFKLFYYGNKYYDENNPWVTRIDNNDLCGNTMYNCVQLITNLSFYSIHLFLIPLKK